MKKLILSLFVWSIAAASFAQVSKTITLTTAGTLASVLTATEQTTITDLTLSGPINADDLTFIKGMTALKNIDMGGASGVTDLGGKFYDMGSLTSIVIPNSVTTIGNSAFSSCYSLTSLTIPNSVTAIGNSAFWGCRGLTSITIPSSVTAIGDEAFIYCGGLTSITIPRSVTSIGESVFSGCRELTSITVDAANLYYSSIDGVLYNKDRTTVIICPERKTGAFVIPNSVTTIGNKAFSGCGGLTSVTIPSSVTSIGDYAFEYCSELISITISNTVTSIGNGAFLIVVV